MSRPVVGITAAIESARWTVWEHVEVNLSPRAYSREIEAAGGVPVVLPSQGMDRTSAVALLVAALERDLPVLAVCRGSQVLNVARGGDLVQHLPEVVGHEQHKHTPGVFGDHEVDVKPDSTVGRLLGERAPVKSHHHQGFGRVGEGLVESAWAAEDGTLEAVEDPSQRFTVGVLWHPEAGEDAALFQALVAEARAYRADRTG